MMARRTFGNKLALGLGVTVGLALIIMAASVAALTVVVGAKDDAIAVAVEDLGAVEHLTTTMERRISNYRAYLLNDTQEYLDLTNQDRQEFLNQVNGLRGTLKDAVALNLLEQVAAAEQKHAEALQPVLDRRKAMTDLKAVTQLNAQAVIPLRKNLESAIVTLTTRVRTDVSVAQDAASKRAAQAIWVIIGLAVIATAFGVVVAWKLGRDLRREVGAVVGHIQSSSAQLEAAAAQQASGGRDQASAMNEITTTISELLITSRQIAESAGRVSKIAEETADAAQSGDTTIDQTRASISAIRSQVDQAASSTSSPSWPSRPTSWPSTRPSRPAAPASGGAASRSSPRRSASSQTGPRARPRRSGRSSRTYAAP
jgi:CHASE3 domain sensor protein